MVKNEKFDRSRNQLKYKYVYDLKNTTGVYALPTVIVYNESFVLLLFSIITWQVSIPYVMIR